MKTGRPKKKESQCKGIVKNIRYSPEEWEKVQKKLDETGLSFSEFIRRASFDVEIKSIDLEVVKLLREVRGNLVKIGNNINIFARNSSGATLGAQHLEDLQNCGELAKQLAVELTKIKDSMK